MTKTARLDALEQAQNAYQALQDEWNQQVKSVLHDLSSIFNDTRNKVLNKTWQRAQSRSDAPDASVVASALGQTEQSYLIHYSRYFNIRFVRISRILPESVEIDVEYNHWTEKEAQTAVLSVPREVFGNAFEGAGLNPWIVAQWTKMLLNKVWDNYQRKVKEAHDANRKKVRYEIDRVERDIAALNKKKVTLLGQTGYYHPVSMQKSRTKRVPKKRPRPESEKNDA